MISDLIKPQPSISLRRWIDGRSEESLYLSVLTLGEMRQGIEMTSADRKKRAKLEQALTDFGARFAGRVLAVDALVAETWGEMSGRSRLKGELVSAVGGLIAATAIAHRLVVVTQMCGISRRPGLTF